MDCNKLKLPFFELKPENTFHKIGQVFGYQDIDFEAFPNFSKGYLLRGLMNQKFVNYLLLELFVSLNLIKTCV